MSLVLRLFVLTAFLTGFAYSVHAGPVEKGFEALKVYNYFEAKTQFEKAVKKYPSVANYGLALIYYRNDNPFHNLDSAYNKIVVSEATYSGMKEKLKEKYKAYQFDYLAIASLRSQVSTAFFAIELKQPTESGMDRYQQKHPWAQERFTAIHLRDSMAFRGATDIQTSAAFDRFLKTYPESAFFTKAQKEFYRLQYLEQTTAGTLASYMSFEKAFPQNPYVADAQDQIYSITTQQNTIPAVAAFIRTYPKNRNVDQAWRRLYQLYMFDYSPGRVEAFQKEYPDYPFKQELIRDKELAGTVLLPYKDNALFGWMSLDGTILIKAAYESVGFFRDGLAWVEKNGKYGYVNKSNELVIGLQFTSANDFEKGRAIVELNGKYGIIDRTGATIFPAEYLDLGQFSEQLIYAQKDSLYGYFDQNGFQRIQPSFSEAYSFSGGKARVKVGELDAFIDPYGIYVVPPLYEEVEFFNDSILTFVDGEFMGLMDRKGKVIAEASYEDIGVAENERGLFVKDEMIGYFSGKGTEAIAPVYDLFPNIMKEGAFSGNYAKVLKGEKFGLIDRSGKTVIPFQYEDLGDVGTMIAFKKGGKWGYIDLSNKVLIAPTYEYAESFVNGLGIVQQLTLQGAINAKGQPVIPLEFTEVKRYDKGHYIVSRGAKYGVFSDKGEVLVPLEYGQIRKIQDDFLLLTKGEEIHYLYLPENKLIQPKITP